MKGSHEVGKARRKRVWFLSDSDSDEEETTSVSKSAGRTQSGTDARSALRPATQVPPATLASLYGSKPDVMTRSISVSAKVTKRRPSFALKSLPSEEQDTSPSREFSARSPASTDIQIFTDKDIVFVFPNESEEGKPAHLWSSIAKLVQVSPYWKQLFNSGYKESESRLERLSNYKNNLTSDLEDIVKQYKSEDHAVLEDLSDSDEEEAAQARPSKRLRASTSENDTAGNIRYVVVTDACMKAYETVLIWIHNGSVTFSALPSANLSRAHRGPASCKSVYALAHKLEIEELKVRACSDFASQLDEVNALKELFSKHASLYPELSGAAMTATITHAKKIKAANGHQYVKEVIGEGKVDPVYAGAIVAELLGKVW